MEPADTLAVIIEAAVALAGFAGIVATLRRDRWTELETLQIANLLMTSFSVLFLSILALVLMHAAVSETTIWMTLSGIYVTVGMVAMFFNFRSIRDLNLGDSKFLFFRPEFIFGTAILTLALQIANVVGIREFWPFLVGVLWLFALSCYSFWGLLTSQNRG